MEGDARSRIMAFISDSFDIWEIFSLAQILQAVQVYCSSFYGSMLNDLYGDEAGMIYRCWNTATKLALQVPRNTFTCLVLNGDLPSLGESLLTRYFAFIRWLSQNSKKEILILHSTANSDGRSTTEKISRIKVRETSTRLETSNKEVILMFARKKNGEFPY